MKQTGWFLAGVFFGASALAYEPGRFPSCDSIGADEESVFTIVQESQSVMTPAEFDALPQDVRSLLHAQALKAVTHLGTLDDVDTIENILNAADEEIAFRVERDGFGNDYDVVNVGFGNGNSADFYFTRGKTEFAPFYIYDGDCVLHVHSIQIPMAIPVVADTQGVQTCVLDAPPTALDPLAKITINYKTHQGHYIADNADDNFAVTIQWNDAYPYHPEQLIENLPAHSTASRPNGTVSVHVGSKNSRGQHAGFGLSQDATGKARLSGRIFFHRVGGYWDSDSQEIKSAFRCEPMSIKKPVSHAYYKFLVDNRLLNLYEGPIDVTPAE